MASRQLLEAVIYHPAHLEALAAFASGQQSNKRPESAAAARNGKQATNEDVPAEEKGHSNAPAYVSLIFQVHYCRVAHVS